MIFVLVTFNSIKIKNFFKHTDNGIYMKTLSISWPYKWGSGNQTSHFWPPPGLIPSHLYFHSNSVFYLVAATDVSDAVTLLLRANNEGNEDCLFLDSLATESYNGENHILLFTIFYKLRYLLHYRPTTGFINIENKFYH